MNTNTAKRAEADHPIHGLLAVRYSPYAFEPKPVPTPQLLSCLEAARWAASSLNEQPWSFIVAGREQADAFERLVDCLIETNEPWASHAGALILTIAFQPFSRNNKPTRMASHDLGLAVATFTVHATDLGLAVHQMAGVNLTRVRQTYQIPDTHDPITMIALFVIRCLGKRQERCKLTITTETRPPSSAGSCPEPCSESGGRVPW